MQTDVAIPEGRFASSNVSWPSGNEKMGMDDESFVEGGFNPSERINDGGRNTLSLSLSTLYHSSQLLSLILPVP